MSDECAMDVNKPARESDSQDIAVLVVLSTGHDGRTITDYGWELAERLGAKARILYVIDSAVADAVFDQLTDLVFVGEAPSNQLAKAIVAEYETRAKDRLEEAQCEAMERSLACETALRRGKVLDSTLDTARGECIGHIVLAEPTRSFLQQVFSHSLAEDLKRAGYQVHVVKPEV